MKEIVNCGRRESYRRIWNMIKLMYNRQQLHKAQQRIARNHEKVAYYSQRIDDVTEQREEY